MLFLMFLLTCDCIRFHKCKLSTLVLENLSKNSTNESSIKISTELGRFSLIANDHPHMINCIHMTNTKSTEN